MKLWFALQLALRETRRARGPLAFSILSVALGVAALGAIQSITGSLQSGLMKEGRQIFGADLSITARQPLDAPLVQELTQDLTNSGARSANSTVFNSMLSKLDPGPSAKRTTLVRIRAVDSAFPFYGTITTNPPGTWQLLEQRPYVVLDPTLARELAAPPGAHLKLGALEVEVLALFEKTAGSPTSEFSFAPLVFMHQRYLAQTGLLQTGSRVDYERLFALPEGTSAEAIKDRYWDRAVDARVSVRTFEESAANVQRFWGRLTRFLLIVGLVVLLLGALGIASSLRVLMRQKADHAAIWRCLGATPRDVLSIYGLLACTIALIGSVLGALIGVLAPWALEGAITRLAGEYLPAHLDLSPSPIAFARAVAAGFISTLCFTLLPLINIANISPLRALRREASGTWSLRRGLLALALVGAAMGLLLVVIGQVGSVPVALAFCASVAATVLVLYLLAIGAESVARRLGRHLPWYAMRQGIANLHRPDSQTRSGIVAVGLGVMLLTALNIFGYSLQRSLQIETRAELPNLFLVDILPDQLPQVRTSLEGAGASAVDLQPMISGRLRAHNGKPIETAQVERHAGRREWTDQLRTREYFFTYRAAAQTSELVVAGNFWNGVPATPEASVEEELARTLQISLGDTLTLDIAGLPFEAKVTSLRRVRWQAMRLNTLIVLSPGPIAEAPAVYMGSLRVPEASARYQLQTDLVQRFPNVSVIDVNEAATTAMSLLARVADVFRVVSLLAIIAGAVIVASAVAASRAARQREAMLLKILGATPRQLLGILTTEYLALAALGAVCGWALAEVSVRLLLPVYFETAVQVPYAQVIATVLGAIAINGLTAAWVGRQVSAARPLALLRDI
jgi:putative ABC transport system permease protein